MVVIVGCKSHEAEQQGIENGFGVDDGSGRAQTCLWNVTAVCDFDDNSEQSAPPERNFDPHTRQHVIRPRRRAVIE